MQLPWRSSMELSWCIHCHGNPSTGWKRISRHRAFQKGVSLLRTTSRHNVDTASAEGRPPDRPERVSFCGLISNFYSLRDKKNSSWTFGHRWLVGALSGDYWSGCLCLIGSQEACQWWQELLATVAKGLGQLRRCPWSWARLLWPWCKVLHLWPGGRTQQLP